MCLISLKHIDLEKALTYELPPIPTALLKDKREMQYHNKKSP